MDSRKPFDWNSRGYALKHSSDQEYEKLQDAIKLYREECRDKMRKYRSKKLQDNR